MAEPGTLKITVDGKIRSGSYTNAIEVVLIDVDANRLLEINLGLTWVDKRVVKRVKIPHSQQLLLRVLLSEGTMDYKVKVEGAVNLEAAHPPRTEQNKQSAQIITNDSPSTDIDNPTWLSANAIRGEGLGKEVSYYYTFMAEPGTLKITVDGKIRSGSYTNAIEVVLMDMDANRLLEINLGLTWVDKRVVKRVKIPHSQQLLLRVLLSEGTMDYKVKVEGAVNLEAVQTSKTKSGTDGATMVLVPAGEFRMGSWEREGESNEHPLHMVDLDAYYIDKYEVTEDLYSRFLLQTNRVGPDHWSGGAGRDAQKPIVGINWDDAQAYCEWAGRRLPTEAEWEKAARSTDKRTYPWGESKPNSSTANFGKDMDLDALYSQNLKDIGSYEQGKSPYEAYDMAGNVGEWVDDWYAEDYYQTSPKKNPKGPLDGTYKIIRGGSWADTPEDLRSAYRLWGTPTGRYAYVGVRCAKDALQPLILYVVHL